MRCRKLFTILFVSLLLTILNITPAHAKRKIPRTVPLNTSTSVNTQTIDGINTSVAFRSDRKAVNVEFSNLSNISTISYVLSYDTDTVSQGLTGTLTNDADDPTLRELIFGTCSASVCTYHTGIINARLTITTELTNGTRIVKPYVLKV